MKKVAIQIFVNKDFHNVFKAAAAKSGKTMKALILELLSKYLDENVDPVSMGMPYDDAVKHPAP